MLEAALSECAGFEIDLPAEVKAVKEAEKLLIGKNECFEKKELLQRELLVPGEVYLEELGLIIKAEILNSRPDNLGDGVSECVLDAEKAGKVLTVRSWKSGDRMKPFGMKSEKKLQDIFVDEKFPKKRRGLIPVITAENGKICWVVGFRISGDFAVEEQTRNFLHLKAEKIDEKEGA
jgi:tRNA(Ile)-lysidine synthase